MLAGERRQRGAGMAAAPAEWSASSWRSVPGLLEIGDRAWLAEVARRARPGHLSGQHLQFARRAELERATGWASRAWYAKPVRR